MINREDIACERSETCRLGLALEEQFAKKQFLYLQLPEIAFQVVQDLSSTISKDSPYLDPIISAVQFGDGWVSLGMADQSEALSVASSSALEAERHYESISNSASRFAVDHGLYSMCRIRLAACLEQIQLSDYYLCQFNKTVTDLGDRCKRLVGTLDVHVGSLNEKQRLVSELISGGLGNKGWTRSFKKKYGNEAFLELSAQGESIQNRFHISLGEALAMSRDVKRHIIEINSIIERMMKINEGALYDIVKPYLSRGFDRDVILSVAREGMARACVKYNPKTNFSFYSYAKRWIVQRVVSYLDSQSSILSVSQEVGPLYRKVRRIRSSGESEGKVVSIRAAAEEAGCSVQDLVAIDQALRPVVAIHQFSDGSDQSERIADLGTTDGAPDSDSEITENVGIIHSLFKRLSLRHANILRSRYGIGCRPQSLEEIADGYGVTSEAIRQTQKKAEEQLLRLAKRGGYSLESFFSK